MAIHDLYSKRRKRERGEIPDVYQYEVIPAPLRVQIKNLWVQFFGQENSFSDFAEDHSVRARVFDYIVRILRNEYGVTNLGPGRTSNTWDEACMLLCSGKEIEQVIDIIEISFKEISSFGQVRSGVTNAESVVKELNARFQEHGVGYQFESGQIMKIDSQIIHAEVVKPALNFLSASDLQGANEEFLSAHEHYRHQHYKECLVDCCKAFESTLKSICIRRSWAYNPTDPGKKLLDVIFQQGLVPAFLQNHFTGLRSTLEGGLLPIRNKMAGHGQGAQPIAVPESVAAYTLHLTATNIVFLDRLEQEFIAAQTLGTP